MPVEVSRIKGRLRELFPKANLSTKRLDEISARLAKKPADDAEDSAIDEVINDANDYMPFADIAKEDDRIRNLEANQKKNESAPADDTKKTTEPTPPTPPTDKDEVPAWAKSLLSTVEELKTGKVIESKTNEARRAFEKNEVFKSLNEKGREFYFKQIDVNSDTPFEDQISELESTHLEITQAKADSGSYAGKPPAGKSNGKASAEEIKAIVG